MADKHSLNYDVRELKLGASFTNNKASQYHTIKYDFKPASVDVNKMATVDVGTNNQVTVTVPHLDGAGVPHTVFKGNQRPYTKECVLFIDRVTGEITLEKLSSNIQVKKTRQESVSKPRPLTPVTSDFTNTTQRSTSRTRVATNKRTAAPPPPALPTPAGQPAGGCGGASAPRYSAQSAPNMVRSPPRQRTSPPQAPWSGGGNSTLASLPMLGFGFEDPTPSHSPAPAPAPAPPPPAPASAPAPTPAPAPAPAHNGYAPPRPHDRREHEKRDKSYERERVERVERMERAQAMTHMPSVVPPQQTADQSSSSSSSDSGSDSGSDSDSDDEATAARPAAVTANPSLPSDVLNDDLCLSESGSDSD